MVINKIKKIIQSCTNASQIDVLIDWIHGCSERKVINHGEYMALSYVLDDVKIRVGWGYHGDS